MRLFQTVSKSAISSWWVIFARTIGLGVALGLFAYWLMGALSAETITITPGVCGTDEEISLQNPGRRLRGYGIATNGRLIVLLTSPSGQFSLIFREPISAPGKTCYLATGQGWVFQ